ncbi:hypothetical protein [Alteraurantiacibacter aestuarii]|uniref:Uncharacterized protein n=1 Tax=Alteraurantiacibacter aestuarii TaxID=650004 RepID=A0A844ZMC0_9SPHN|nr:hypothetical protein [Alteraurantiacibacter aestuarii]MXO88246.1 hypothetical protein [Alteraurantiacibacter aestuarii]
MLLLTVGAILAAAACAGQAKSGWDGFDIESQISEFDKIKGELEVRLEVGEESERDFENSWRYEEEYSESIGSVDIFHCYPPYYTGDDPEYRNEFYNRLAKQTVGIERRLREAGYLSEIYQGPLRDYEIRSIYRSYRIVAPHVSTNQFDGVLRGDPEFKILTMRIEQNRRVMQSESLPIVASGECGDGDVPYLFSTIPANASLWIIPEFDSLICERRAIDPWNRDQCFGWYESTPSEEVYLSGRYLFVAEWPDGTVRRGRRLFEADEVTRDARLIVIRKQ